MPGQAGEIGGGEAEPVETEAREREARDAGAREWETREARPREPEAGNMNLRNAEAVRPTGVHGRGRSPAR